MILNAYDIAHHFLIETPAVREGDQYANYPLAGPGYPMVLLTIVYMLFVFKIGPRFMKNRPAYDLKKILVFYNWAQIIMNSFIVIGAAVLYFTNKRIARVSCLMSLPFDDPDRPLEFWTTYGYYLIKLIDYLDTVFFVLRKSFKQVTFLHVYHHVVMVLMVYCHLRYSGSGGHLAGLCSLNSLVHMIMYGYYLKAAQTPSTAQTTLWWKKYITLIQLAQFVAAIVHNIWSFIFRPDCEYSRTWRYMGLAQEIFMIYLFGNFYRKAYLQPPKEKTIKKKNT